MALIKIKQSVQVTPIWIISSRFCYFSVIDLHLHALKQTAEYCFTAYFYTRLRHCPAVRFGYFERHFHHGIRQLVDERRAKASKLKRNFILKEGFWNNFSVFCFFLNDCPRVIFQRNWMLGNYYKYLIFFVKSGGHVTARPYFNLRWLSIFTVTVPLVLPKGKNLKMAILHKLSLVD